MKYEDAVVTYNLCDHTIEKQLGRGGYGEVFLAHPHENREFKFAVKKARAYTPEERDKVGHELAIHLRLTHHGSRFIIACRDYQEVKFPLYNVISLFLELAPNGAVKDIIGKPELTSGMARRILKELCNALNFIHQLHIVHGDIKPHNMLLDQNFRLKLADFGLSREQNGDNKSRCIIFTPAYGAPELFRDQMVDGRAADVYAAGITMFQMLTGTFPWNKADAHRDPEYSDWIRGRTNTSQDAWSLLDEKEIEFFKQVFTSNPDTRPKTRWVFNYRFTHPAELPTRPTPPPKPVATVTESVQEAPVRQAQDSPLVFPLVFPEALVKPRRGRPPKAKKEIVDVVPVAAPEAPVQQRRGRKRQAQDTHPIAPVAVPEAPVKPRRGRPPKAKKEIVDPVPVAAPAKRRRI